MAISISQASDLRCPLVLLGNLVLGTAVSEALGQIALVTTVTDLEEMFVVLTGFQIDSTAEGYSTILNNSIRTFILILKKIPTYQHLFGSIGLFALRNSSIIEDATILLFG